MLLIIFTLQLYERNICECPWHYIQPLTVAEVQLDDVCVGPAWVTQKFVEDRDPCRALPRATVINFTSGAS